MRNFTIAMVTLLIAPFLNPTPSNAVGQCPETWNTEIPAVIYQENMFNFRTIQVPRWTFKALMESQDKSISSFLNQITEGAKSGEIISTQVIEFSETPDFLNSKVIALNRFNQPLTAFSLVKLGIRDGFYLRHKVEVRQKNCSGKIFLGVPATFSAELYSLTSIDSFINLGKSAETKFNFEEEGQIRKNILEYKNTIANIQISRPFNLPSMPRNTNLVTTLTSRNSTCEISIAQYLPIIRTPGTCEIDLFIRPSSMGSNYELYLLVESYKINLKETPSPSPVATLPPAKSKPTLEEIEAAKLDPARAAKEAERKRAAELALAEKAFKTKVKCKQLKVIYVIQGTKCPNGLSRV
jgi:hypothetical protein